MFDDEDDDEINKEKKIYEKCVFKKLKKNEKKEKFVRDIAIIIFVVVE